MNDLDLLFKGKGKFVSGKSPMNFMVCDRTLQGHLADVSFLRFYFTCYSWALVMSRMLPFCHNIVNHSIRVKYKRPACLLPFSKFMPSAHRSFRLCPSPGIPGPLETIISFWNVWICRPKCHKGSNRRRREGSSSSCAHENFLKDYS